MCSGVVVCSAEMGICMQISDLWTWIDTYYIWILFLWLAVYAVTKSIWSDGTHFAGVMRRRENVAVSPLKKPQEGFFFPVFLFRHFLFFSAVIYFATLFFLTMVRHPYPEMKYELSFLWEYRNALAGSEFLRREIRDNILLFVPFGILASEFMEQSQQGIDARKVVLLGFCISVIIEVSQLVFKLGLFEFDDMLNNTIGTLLGYLFFWIRGLLCVRWTVVQERG